MRTIPTASYFCTVKAYYSLTKPGIIMGNLITMAGGFALASRGQINPLLFFATLVGLSCIIGSACVFNNFIDREADEKMLRTKNRALARGLISAKNALVFASALGLLGVLALTFLANLLTLAVALIGVAVYVLFYSFLKYHSAHSTLVGGIAGAVPPVIGYCAVSNHFDLAAWILFAIVLMWQMPHFFAIAIYRMEEYRTASIPVLPLVKGIVSTKIHMLLYILGFIAASSLLPFFHYVRWGFLAIPLPLGCIWLILAVRGFKAVSNTRWARQMFLFSLVVITLEFIALAFA